MVDVKSMQTEPGHSPQNASRSQPVRAVVKVMSILEMLAEYDSCGVTELAESVNMNKSTVYRFLNTLRQIGYVRQHADNEQYSLSLRLFELGSQVVTRMDIWDEAHAVMNHLGEETGETIHLATLDDDQLVYLRKVDSSRSLRVTMMSQVGHTAPTYCTGLGKALLAFSEAGFVDALLNSTKLTKHTEHTITDSDRLRKELYDIRERGYAIDYEEHEVGVRCVAAPVFGPQDELVAALSVSAPSVRLTDDRFPEFANLVVAAAAKISVGLRSRLH